MSPGPVKVEPEDFHLVYFDPAGIGVIATRMAGLVGLSDALGIVIQVDETAVLGRVRIESLAPELVVSVQGGAFEDPRKPRQMSDRAVSEVLGRVFHRAKDCLDPDFGPPPADDELSLAQFIAWETYCAGRSDHLGIPVNRGRWQYHFRNRHGFNDVADAAFNRLWDASGLKWSDIDAVCTETQGWRQPA
ncbi:MAG: hypothetical protein ACYCS7_15095 [Acidimicrobiales bacterium]